MRVHIIGPNLRDQSKGDFHVHAEGCADVQRNPEYQVPDYDTDRKLVYDVTSQRDVSEFIYSDMIGEGSMTWQDGVDTFHLSPCVGDLPMDTPKLPLPNETIDGGIVIASVWGNDMPDEGGIPVWAQLLLLMPESPYYRRIEITWENGDHWNVTLRQSHENIVPATKDYENSGGDY